MPSKERARARTRYLSCSSMMDRTNCCSAGVPVSFEGPLAATAPVKHTLTHAVAASTRCGQLKLRLGAYKYHKILLHEWGWVRINSRPSECTHATSVLNEHSVSAS
eukprot:1160284-Pelagomonas_calceolata.AAC.5